MRWIGLRHQDMNHPQVRIVRSLAHSITAAVPYDRTNTTIALLADILKARIQTLGVEEHPLRVETGTIGAYDTASRALCTHTHC
jgi:hypothetical protein